MLTVSLCTEMQARPLGAPTEPAVYVLWCHWLPNVYTTTRLASSAKSVTATQYLHYCVWVRVNKFKCI